MACKRTRIDIYSNQLTLVVATASGRNDTSVNYNAHTIGLQITCWMKWYSTSRLRNIWSSLYCWVNKKLYINWQNAVTKTYNILYNENQQSLLEIMFIYEKYAFYVAVIHTFGFTTGTNINLKTKPSAPFRGILFLLRIVCNKFNSNWIQLDTVSYVVGTI